MKKILIYMPAHMYGGTELLLTRFSNHLAINNEVFLYFSDQNLINKLAVKENVKVLSLLSQIYDTEYDLTIFSAKVLRYVVKNCSRIQTKRFLLWQLHPDELCSQFFPYINRMRIFNQYFYTLRSWGIRVLYFKRRNKVTSLIKILEDYSILYYMDSATKNETSRWLNNKINDNMNNYFPVVVQPKKQDLKYKLDCNVLNVLIVSRISFDFKYYPIISALEALKSSVIDRYVVVKIVGDGNAFSALQKIAVAMTTINFKVELLGFVPIEEVIDTIYPDIDLAIGMGTSVLDSSSLAIPTILMEVHACYVSHEYINYSWLYKNEGYMLGGYLDNTISYGNKMEELLKELIRDPETASRMTFDYFTENHSSEVVFSRIERELFMEPNVHFDLISAVESVISKNIFSEKLVEMFFTFFRKIKRKLI